MTRTEIRDVAKRMILDHGPANVLEFGDEIFRDHTPHGDPLWAHREQILAEATRQAHRVYAFLGYVRR